MTTLDAQRLAREGYSRPSANGVTVAFFQSFLCVSIIFHIRRAAQAAGEDCVGAHCFIVNPLEKSGPAGQRQAVQGTQDVTVGQ